MFIEYKGKSPRVSASAFVAPNAVLVGDVVVGAESSVWFGVVLRADGGTIRIGARCAVEDNAVIHATDGVTTRIADDVTVGHCAVLDDCVIEKGALVGSNAVILQGATVGASAVVAAGSVVTVEAQVPERVVAAGAPATIRKTVAGRAATWVAHGTGTSVAQAQAYRRDNIGDPSRHELKSASRKKRASALA